jgi:hypothetical protein
VVGGAKVMRGLLHLRNAGLFGDLVFDGRGRPNGDDEGHEVRLSVEKYSALPDPLLLRGVA